MNEPLHVEKPELDYADRMSWLDRLEEREYDGIDLWLRIAVGFAVGMAFGIFAAFFILALVSG